MKECDTCKNQSKWTREVKYWGNDGYLQREKITTINCSLCNSAYRCDCPEWISKEEK